MRIILAFPLALFGQDNNVGTVCDAAINSVLEITVNYLQHKNDVDPDKHLEFKTKQYSIDWKNKQLMKWQIIKPKDLPKIINYD